MPSPTPLSPLLLNDPLIGQTVGGYVVEQPLGEGGMGLIFRARHPILNRFFAVKVLRPEVAQDAYVSQTFIREAQTLSSLKHPHIIDIVGFGPLDDGRQYMVTEFLEGKTLRDELDEKGQMTPLRALELADQMLDALAAAHSVDIVHRDLKPANVFLSKASGGREVVKLLDFGLAKQAPQLLSDAPVAAAPGGSVLAGTPEYIAPEQALGRAASRQSDLYSFGVMLYEMLTGKLPFWAPDEDPDRLRTLLGMHLHKRAPSLAANGNGFFPGELEEVIADLLKKEPEDRPSGADTVRSRLQRVQRLVQQESTSVGQHNPLLTSPATSQVLPAPPPRTLPMPSPADAPPAPARRSRTWLAIVPLLVLLLSAGVWLSSRPVARPVVLQAPAPSVPAAIAVAPIDKPAAPPAPAPAPTPPAQAKPVTPAPVAAPTPQAPRTKTGNAYRVEIRKTGCEPSDRWKNEARSNLQEIQQVAAGRDDRKAWALFERSEPEISAAIGAASTGEDCEKVEQKIQKLARKFKP